MKRYLIALIRPVRKNQKGDLRIVAFCILGSALFWLFNALTKDYSTIIAYPIRFEYDQDKIMPLSKLPSNINLDVTGTGWNLLSGSLSSNLKPYVYHLSESRALGQNITFSGLYPFVQKSMHGLVVNNVIVDSLNLNFDSRITKIVPIILDTTTITIAHDFYRASKVEMSPKVLVYSGPKMLIRDIEDTIFFHLPRRNIDTPYNEVISFNQNNPLIDVDQKQISVKFDVKRK